MTDAEAMLRHRLIRRSTARQIMLAALERAAWFGFGVLLGMVIA